MNTKLNFIVVSLILILITLSTGCFTPINSTFESAKLLDKGEIEMQGNYSIYYGDYGNFLGDDYVNLNNNFGLGVGYGITDRFNMKLRYERINTKYSIEIFDEEININGLNYIELSNKFSLKKDEIAASMPLSIYLYEGESVFSLDPRFFFTFGKNENFEFNLIPKAHIFVGDEIVFLPGINFGLGLSSNLNKWAIRPEFGFDGNFTFGVGVNYYFKPNKGE